MAEQPRERLVRALNAGAAAGRGGTEPTSCPYPIRSPEWAAWVRGYAKTARLPHEADS
ncbi:Rmf/CrpP fold protein [Streptomyces sp. ODS28]|uniref:Rmf/CrpP fold protein n=1 Tax=Streptomyces sp. ODS28 TaxID=3136688 RepID=UPI0031E72447